MLVYVEDVENCFISQKQVKRLRGTYLSPYPTKIHHPKPIGGPKPVSAEDSPNIFVEVVPLTGQEKIVTRRYCLNVLLFQTVMTNRRRDRFISGDRMLSVLWRHISWMQYRRRVSLIVLFCRQLEGMLQYKDNFGCSVHWGPVIRPDRIKGPPSAQFDIRPTLLSGRTRYLAKMTG